jgi:hypothetical protein
MQEDAFMALMIASVCQLSYHEMSIASTMKATAKEKERHSIG